jgi:hypothetical protein
MNNRIPQSGKTTQAHDHSPSGRNLTLIGVEHRLIKDGVGLVVGFKKVRIFKCRICFMKIEEVGKEFFSLGGY